MTNKEKYDIQYLEAVVEDNNAIIYYFPNGVRSDMKIVRFIYNYSTDKTIYECIEEWHNN